MASMREYLNCMEVTQLECILEMEARGFPRYDLPTIWLICEALAKKKSGGVTAKQVFLDYCEAFADSRG